MLWGMMKIKLAILTIVWWLLCMPEGEYTFHKTRDKQLVKMILAVFPNTARYLKKEH